MGRNTVARKAPPPRPHATQARQGGVALEATLLSRGRLREAHLTLRPPPGAPPAASIQCLLEALRDLDAAVLRHEIFGRLDARPETMAALRDGLGGEPDWPVAWIEGCGGRRTASPIDGMHVLAVRGAPVRTIRLAGRPVGRLVDDGLARHAFFHDLLPEDVSRSAPDQARDVLGRLETALDEAGMGLPCLARTWLFLDNILDWYGAFNSVRTAFFRSRGVFNRLTPASTGVAGRNAAGAALVLGAWAVQPQGKAPLVREVPSPLQGPALDYGSGFSRAVEIDVPGGTRLLISGTASIDAGGRTARTGDIDGQIALTLEVVEAILASRGMGWPHVTRATAYFRDRRDFPRLKVWDAGRGRIPRALVRTATTICRDDLLFEIEVDAARAGG